MRNLVLSRVQIHEIVKITLLTHFGECLFFNLKSDTIRCSGQWHTILKTYISRTTHSNGFFYFTDSSPPRLPNSIRSALAKDIQKSSLKDFGR